MPEFSILIQGVKHRGSRQTQTPSLCGHAPADDVQEYQPKDAAVTMLAAKPLGRSLRVKFLLAVLVSMAGISCSGDKSVSTRGITPTGTVMVAPAAKSLVDAQVVLSDLPESHGGSEFDFTLTYHVRHPTSYTTVPDSVSVTNATVGGARRAHVAATDRNKIWSVTIEPKGQDDVTITVRDASATVPATAPDPPPNEGDEEDEEEDDQSSDSAAPPVLSNVPEANNGGVFTFTVTYVEDIPTSRSTVVDDVEIEGGTVYSVKRVVKTGPDMNKAWNVMVVPESQYVTITIRVRGATAEMIDHLTLAEAERQARMVDNVTFSSPRRRAGVTEGTCDGSARLKAGHEADATVTLDATGTPISFLAGTDTVKTQDFTFTTVTWDTYQTATICGPEDYDSDDESYEVAVTAVGGNYVDYSSTLTVTVNDDDEPHIVLISPSAISGVHDGSSNPSMTVTEGQTFTLKWRLGTIPNEDLFDGIRYGVTFALNHWEQRGDDPFTTQRMVSPDLIVRPTIDGTPSVETIFPSYPNGEGCCATYSTTVTIKEDRDEEDEVGILRLGTHDAYVGTGSLQRAREYRWRRWDIDITVIDNDK